MTDNELRDAVVRELGWAPFEFATWTTAGALLELCARSEDKNRIYLGGAFVFLKYVDREEVEWSGEITPRNVIEACVMALGSEPPSATHDQSIA